jgi:LmbE family N-acetylglucosaminyl deacetylase
LSFTVVFFHAHPDDEALLTGGTMARLAAEGHRVVLAVATAGEAGLAPGELTSGGRLGAVRRAEAEESARLLGCERVEVFGYPDSGMGGNDAGPDGFSHIPPEGPARRLASLLADEDAAALVGYDPAGGYGHPDHVQVHRVARMAGAMASVRLHLEVTVDRRALARALSVASLIRPGSRDLVPWGVDDKFADPSTITHAVNVRRFAERKRSALAAHTSQGTADAADRAIAWLLRVPSPVFGLVMGTEWFTEVGRRPGRRRLRDPLASLRTP